MGLDINLNTSKIDISEEDGLNVDLYNDNIDISDDEADDIIIEITGLKSISKFIGLEDTPLYYDNGKFFKVEDNKIVYTDIQWKDISGDISESPEIVAVISDLINEVASDIIDERINLHNLNAQAHPFIQNIIQENYNTLDTKIDNTKEELSEALNTEIINRETADNELYENIQQETLARIESDATLQNNINTLTNNLNTEIENRTNADDLLRDDINNISGELAQEILNRQTQDNLLQEQITSNYNTLDDKIDTEILNRASADTTLQNNIDAEALARQNADATLQGNIDTLSNTVSSNYNDLSDKIDNLSDIVSDNYTDLDGKISDLTDTVNDNDTAINNKVDGINTNLTTSINNLSNTVSSNYTTLNTKIDNTKTSLEGDISDLSTTVSNNYTTLDGKITNLTSTVNDNYTELDGRITTNTNDISTINSKIPNQASSSNQLADKDFVNSSIATNTANFIGTFNSVAELESYTGTVTNNDYAFVINTVITDNGNDWSSFASLDARSKTDLTNFDYAWVINGTKFDIYRFDIINQEWLLRASNIDKEDVSLNDVYNRYKASVSGSTVTWDFEYTLNNSSFTATQWASINSEATVDKINQIATNTTNIINLQTTKQDVLTAGANIQISNNIISATDTTYTAGTGISIENNIISNTQTSAVWGNIQGTLSDQTDLQNALNDKYDASNPNGFISSITSSDVTTALGYTPYDTTNPNGYINTSALNGYATENWVTNQNYVNSTTLATTLNNYVLSADLATVATSGDYNDLINKPTEITESTVSGWGFTKNVGTVTSVNSILPDSNGNVSIPISGAPTWGEIIGDISDQTDLQTALGNFVTLNTAQNISSRKTFLGEKAIYFKQISASNKLGFTLYNISNAEIGALEYRPNTIGSNALLALNCPQTTGGYVGFRYWGTLATNIVAPKPTTAGNYYIPVNFTDGTNTVTSDSTGIVNLTSLLPDLSSYQPLLVSGSNIKTINGDSILGSGNLTLDGLPSQAGQNGKFLTTNGTEASWANTTKVTIRDWSVA